MGRYDYAESLLNFLSAVAWLGMALGVAVGLYLGFTTEDARMPIMIVVPTIVSGIALLALAQVGRAILDIAANSFPAAQWAEEQLREVRQQQKAIAAEHATPARNRVSHSASSSGFRMAPVPDEDQNGRGGRGDRKW